MCVFVRAKETGGCWWARGDFTVRVLTCVREVDLWVTDRWERAVLGGLHHGRPNAKGRDTSEQKGMMLTSMQRPPWERENPCTINHQLPFTVILCILVARFAMQCKEFEFASARRDTPPTFLLRIPAVKQCHPCLYKKSFSLSPWANTSTWRAPASRGSSRHGREDFYTAGEAADNVIEINPAPITRAYLFENRLIKERNKSQKYPLPKKKQWIPTNPRGLFITKCGKSNQVPKIAASSCMSHWINPLLERASVTQPRLTGFTSEAYKRLSFFFPLPITSWHLIFIGFYSFIFLVFCNLLCCFWWRW